MFHPEQELVGNFSVVDPTFKRILTEATPEMLEHGKFRGEIPDQRLGYFLLVVSGLHEDGNQGNFYFVIMGVLMPSREALKARVLQILAWAAADAAARAAADTYARQNWDTPICG